MTAINISGDSELSSLLFYHYIDGGSNLSRTYTPDEKKKLEMV
jgi:hypothetical protein